MNKRSSYQEERYWQHYQPYFPKHLRLNASVMPDEEWWSWRGIDVHLDRYASQDSQGSKVIMLHGGGGYARLLSPFAVDLRSKGHHVLLPDLPGYGLTRAPSNYVDYQGWADLVVDLVYQEYERDKQPIVLYGLSLGGMLAYYSASRSPLVKGVIATTLCDPRLVSVINAFTKYPTLSRASLPILRLLEPIIGHVRLPLKWFCKMDALSNNIEFNHLVMNDQLGGGNRTPLHFLQSIVDAKPSVEPESFNDVPVLLAHPSEDRWTPFDVSKSFYQRLASDKQVVLLDNAGHMPIEKPGLEKLCIAAQDFLAEIVTANRQQV